MSESPKFNRKLAVDSAVVGLSLIGGLSYGLASGRVYAEGMLSHGMLDFPHFVLTISGGIIAAMAGAAPAALTFDSFKENKPFSSKLLFTSLLASSIMGIPSAIFMNNGLNSMFPYNQPVNMIGSILQGAFVTGSIGLVTYRANQAKEENR